jgi:hypothetical protein
MGPSGPVWFPAQLMDSVEAMTTFVEREARDGHTGRLAAAPSGVSSPVVRAGRPG